jgi:hypothetical protein
MLVLMAECEELAAGITGTEECNIVLRELRVIVNAMEHA